MSILAKIALGTTALVAMGSTAMAADLMAPPPPAAAMTSNWTGLYLGLGGQYLAVEQNGTRLAEGGVILGADFETGMFLVGARGELGFSHNVGTNTNDWAATIEGRAGVVVSDNALIYAGLGVEHYFHFGDNHPSLGVGVEFKTSDNLSVDLEYKHSWSIGSPLVADSISGSLLWHFH